MTAGVYTWDDLPAIDGNLLVVINSAAGDTEAAATLLTAILARVPMSAVHVVAERTWQAWLSERGVPPAQVLLCADYEGRDIEINHFLESPDLVLWAADKQCRTMVGSDPHDLHNERVNVIFEQRALLLIGDGRLLAHSLPTPYVYVFDVPALLARLVRPAKIRAYEQTAHALLADLHQAWLAAGSPPRGDHADYDDVLPILTKHLGAPVIDYDEAGPIPIASTVVPDEMAGVVAHFQALVREHDRQLQVWSRAYAERKEAADVREAGIRLRDEIIDDLRLQLEPWHRKLRRRWNAPRG